MKVLSFNVGYFLGFQSQREWLRRPHRLLLGNKHDENGGMATLVDLLADERPDVVALQEVDLGSVRSRFTDQSRSLLNRLQAAGLEYDHRADVKYDSHTTVGSLPVLRNMSNMLLWREGVGNARYLSDGTKRLVQLVECDGRPTVLSVHLSKTKDTREDQLRDIAEIADEYDRVVLAGDFNVKNRDEFDILTDRHGFELHVPGKSFSTAYPTYAYDVFLTSGGLSVNRCEVLDDVTFSDHMPVVADISPS